MKKKIIFSLIVIIILLVIAGGFFWWWKDQRDVRELNKNLPKGLRVVKSLSGEYRVVNKIDGYEIRVPREWRGLARIDYVLERKINGMTGSGLVLTNPIGIIIGIDQYQTDQPEKETELESLIKEFFEPEGILEKIQIGNYEVIKVKIERLGGAKVYFLKPNSKVYVVGGLYDNDIQEIIFNGKW
jgi:hypothetical protein